MCLSLDNPLDLEPDVHLLHVPEDMTILSQNGTSPCSNPAYLIRGQRPVVSD